MISAFQTAGTAMTDSLIQIATPILTVIGVFVAAYGIMRNTENAKSAQALSMKSPIRRDFFTKLTVSNIRGYCNEIY